MTAAALLLRKDLTVLRRSPLLLGALLAYPVVIALLVGLVAGYASSKPRVAYVDLDHVPSVVQVAGQSFHVQSIIDEVSQNVTLVPMSAREARSELASGKVVEAHSRDLSTTGLFVLTAAPLAVGTLYQISIMIPGAEAFSEEVHHAKAKVVRRDEGGYGVELISPDAKLLAALAAL